MDCVYFDSHLCRSCTLMGTGYEQQLDGKLRRVQQTLAADVNADAWDEPFTSRENGFRNKAKLAVGGTLQRPTLGITGRDGQGIDLRECGIHERAIWEVVPDLAGFITWTGLRPYDVGERSGDLKFILLTANPRGDLMVRFVVRERAHVQAVRRGLPALLRRLPHIRVVSANIHPEHKAVIEGPDEIPLSAQTELPMPLGERTLYLHHRSFFQTNTAVAQGLYDQARTWADALAPRRVLDLYCGVGGFAVHLAGPGRDVHGIEVEPDAVASARRAAEELRDATPNLGALSFDVADADTADLGPVGEQPDLVIVNPPRRGIGAPLARELNDSRVRSVLYSSCNPASLALDLAAMPSWRVERARLFDMFPQTDHAEVAVLLGR